MLSYVFFETSKSDNEINMHEITNIKKKKKKQTKYKAAIIELKTINKIYPFSYQSRWKLMNRVTNCNKSNGEADYSWEDDELSEVDEKRDRDLRRGKWETDVQESEERKRKDIEKEGNFELKWLLKWNTILPSNYSKIVVYTLDKYGRND